MTTDTHIDARGLTCPMPLMLLKQAMAAQDDAPKFTIRVTDPHAELDLITWCERMGHALATLPSNEENSWLFQVTR